MMFKIVYIALPSNVELDIMFKKYFVIYSSCLLYTFQNFPVDRNTLLTLSEMCLCRYSYLCSVDC